MCSTTLHAPSVIKSKHPRLAPATLIGLCRTVDHMQCWHRGDTSTTLSSRERLTPPGTVVHPVLEYPEPLHILNFSHSFGCVLSSFVTYTVSLSHFNLKRLHVLLFHSSSAYSVRSIGPTYYTNEPSVRQCAVGNCWYTNAFCST